jgi:hypothetical protein
MASALHPWAITVAGNLKDNEAWAKLKRGALGKKIEEIPSLSRRLRCYRFTDFDTIANRIQSGAIELETFRDPDGPPAEYVWKGNLLRINKAHSAEPAAARSHVVHEAAHAIQDHRRMFLSKPEAEHDGHFVHAVYCIVAGCEDEVADYATEGKALAREFLAAGRLDRCSERLKDIQKSFYDDILAHYTNVDTTHSGDFDVKANALERERRLRDGIRRRR